MLELDDLLPELVERPLLRLPWKGTLRGGWRNERERALRPPADFAIFDFFWTSIDRRIIFCAFSTEMPPATDSRRCSAIFLCLSSCSK